METAESICTVQLGMGWFPEQDGNGLDRVYHALACHLPGADVAVHGLVTGSPEVSHAADHGVHSFAPSTASLPRRLLAARRQARRLLAEQQPDLVAAHFALYAAPLLDLLADTPLVIHFHGPWASESKEEGEGALKTMIKAAVERMVYRRGSRFVVLSEAFRDMLARDYGVPEAQIRVVPGGVEAERFDTGCTRREARERLGWPVERPIILSVRRLVRRVGLENLVDAMQEVHRQRPEALLFIAGKGPLKTALNQRIQAAGLEQHVRLLGFVPDDELPLAYRAADLSVVPTVALEGFGLIAVESLAAGTPVLVTPVGGLPEVVRDLSGELVLPDARSETLGERLTAALDGRLPLPPPEVCQAYAQERFDWPVIAAQVREVYGEVLA